MVRSRSHSVLRLAQVVLTLLSIAPLTEPAAAKPFRLDPARPMTQYVTAAWRDSSGLPADSIAGLAQTPDGYLWIATEHGLVRFDGVRFTTFTRQNTPALLTNDIFSLFVSKNGTLWIATRGGGALTWNGTHFARVPIRYRFIGGIAESQDGAIWIAALGGVARFHAGEWTTFEKDQGYPMGRYESIAADANGVFVARGPEIVRLGPDGVRRWSETDGLSGGDVRSLAWTSRGLLAGNEAGGIDRLAGNRFEPLIPPGSRHAVTSIVEGAGGSLWLSTIGGGIVRHHDGRLDALTTADGLTANSINQLFEDQEGNLWAGTVGGGIVRVTQGSITSILPPGSLDAEWILSMGRGRDGSVWFTTHGGGLYRWYEETLSRLGRRDGLLPGIITAIAEDGEGTLWVGFESGVQRIRDGNVLETLTAREGLEGLPAHAITASRDGGVWIGTNGGLHRYAQGRLRRLTEKDGMTRGSVVSIREAVDGSLWLAKPSSVERHVNGNVTIFGADDGLRSRMITSITLDDRDGSVWVATMGDGLARIRDGRVRTYRMSDGLLHDSVYAVVLDTAGNLWIPTGVGLFTIRRADLDAFDAGTAPSIRTRVFRKPDGLRSNDFSGGFDRPGFRAGDGKLWFATTRGVAVVDPAHRRAAALAPRVLIESVTANGERYDNAAIDLPPAQRQIDIAYTSPSFHSPETARFEFKLEGFDREWRDAGTRRTAYYTNVPPGQYRFRVRTTTAENVTAEASTPVTIVPRFYERRLFHLTLILGAVLFALVLHRIRTDELHRHQDELRQSEEHFRSLIENGSDMILVVDAGEAISYASPSVMRVLAIDPSAMRGRPLESFLVRRSDASTLLTAVRAAGSHTATLLFRDGAGAEREIETIGAVDGKDGVILNCRDVTDRRRLESQLEQANRLSSLGRLAATVSHEFNNVLMGVQPYVDIIRRKTDDETIQHATQQMARSVDRGKRISEQILRYTRPVEPKVARMPVRQWLRDLEIEIRALAGPNVRVAVVAADDLAIEGDAAQLNQVLTNLAINASDAGATQIVLEAMPLAGNGVFPFGIVRDPETFVQIVVRDNGKGIPESVKPKIFEPLFTTKTTKGTGLGLAVAHQVVARHGGEIFVESTVGTGTAFHLFLPRSAGEPAVTVGAVQQVAPDRQRGRVLFVEDDAAIAEGILALLESEGFDVTLAVNGGDALHLLDHVEPDVVILDVGLPDISGIELYQRINEKHPDLPVIFSTGHVDLGLLQESLPPPHPPCLLKPYEIDTLLTTIAAVVGDGAVN